MISSMHRIALYVNTLEGNTSNMYKAVDEYRESKNRAVIRARKSEEDLHSLEKENLMLKDKFKLKLWVKKKSTTDLQIMPLGVLI